MGQINISKTGTFQIPPTGKRGYGFNSDGVPVIIDEYGQIIILNSSLQKQPTLVANLGIGLESALPAITGTGDVYVTTDTLKIYTATSLDTWSIEDLADGQMVTDSSMVTAMILWQLIEGVLTQIGDSYYKGWYATEAALIASHPTGQNGWYATVGDTDTTWIWDVDTNAWVDSGIVYAGMANEIINAGVKAIPVDADVFGFVDTEDTNILKKFTWANIKSVLKTYFDSLYQAIGSYLTSISQDLTPQLGGHLNANYKRILNSQGDDIASANNLTLNGTNNGNTYAITGTTQINLIDSTQWQNGSEINLVFENALILKDNQTSSGNYKKINTADGADISITSGMVIGLVLKDNEWWEVGRVGGGGGGGGHVIYNDGVSMTSRNGLNFVGFTLTDDSGNDWTKVDHVFGDEANVDNTNQVEGSVKAWDTFTGKYIDQEQEEFDDLITLMESGLSSSSSLLAIYIPAGYSPIKVSINETNSAAATDIDIGFSAAATDLVANESCLANEKKLLVFTDFVASADQDLYITITGSAILDLVIKCVKIW